MVENVRKLKEKLDVGFCCVCVCVWWPSLPCGLASRSVREVLFFSLYDTRKADTLGRFLDRETQHVRTPSNGTLLLPKASNSIQRRSNSYLYPAAFKITTQIFDWLKTVYSSYFAISVVGHYGQWCYPPFLSYVKTVGLCDTYCYYYYYYLIITCNWVDTRWQQSLHVTLARTMKILL